MKNTMSAFVVLLAIYMFCVPLYGQVATRQTETTDGLSAPLVMAQTAANHIRFTAMTIGSRMRLEILSAAGSMLFDSGLRPGNLIEWLLADKRDSRLPDGIYGCIVTVEQLSGRVTYRRGLFHLLDGKAAFVAPVSFRLENAAAGEREESISILGTDDRLPFAFVGHDGTDARVESMAGGLIFQAGRFHALEADQSPHMHLTQEGNLGIGVRKPQARLDVAGLIRTSEGIQFPDGSILISAYGIQNYGVFLSSRETTGAGREASHFSGSSLAQGGLSARRGSSRETGGEKPMASTGEVSRVESLEGITNTFYGQNAGQSITQSGWGNSFFGYDAGQSTTTGVRNSVFGNYAGQYNTGGSLNSLFGESAGRLTNGGGDNSFFGAIAGYNNTTGSFNSFVGLSAGASNTTEHYNTFIGANSDGAAGITNATAIGNRAKVTQSNSMVLGSINGVNSATADTKVGIGTTTPDRKLQIASSPGMNAELHIGGAGDETKDVFSGVGVDLSAGPSFNFGYSGFSFGRSSGFFNVRPDPSAAAPNPSLRFMTVNQQRMIITNTGNVGIGTTSPTEKLHVAGNLRVTGSILYGAADVEVPDFVFEPGYRLMPVADLEKYLASEKHLPNVPSASEIKERGLSLSDFQMKLLEKIEELTLYTVQQAKSLDRKESEIAALTRHNVDLDAKNSSLEAKVAMIPALEAKVAVIASLEARLAAMEQMLARQQDQEQK